MGFPTSLLEERPAILKQEFRLLCADNRQISTEGFRLAGLFRDTCKGPEPDTAGLYLAELLEQLAGRVWEFEHGEYEPDLPVFIVEDYDETVQ